jgi:hypothetical protein
MKLLNMKSTCTTVYIKQFIKVRSYSSPLRISAKLTSEGKPITISVNITLNKHVTVLTVWQLLREDFAEDKAATATSDCRLPGNQLQ